MNSHLFTPHYDYICSLQNSSNLFNSALSVTMCQLLSKFQFFALIITVKATADKHKSGGRSSERPPAGHYLAPAKLPLCIPLLLLYHLLPLCLLHGLLHFLRAKWHAHISSGKVTGQNLVFMRVYSLFALTRTPPWPGACW